MDNNFDKAKLNSKLNEESNALFSQPLKYASNSQGNIANEKKFSLNYKDKLSKKEIKKLKKMRVSTSFKLSTWFAGLFWFLISFISVIILAILFFGPKVVWAISGKPAEPPQDSSKLNKMIYNTVDGCSKTSVSGCIKEVEYLFVDELFPSTVNTIIDGGILPWETESDIDGLNCEIKNALQPEIEKAISNANIQIDNVNTKILDLLINKTITINYPGQPWDGSHSSMDFINLINENHPITPTPNYIPLTDSDIPKIVTITKDWINYDNLINSENILQNLPSPKDEGFSFIDFGIAVLDNVSSESINTLSDVISNFIFNVETDIIGNDIINDPNTLKGQLIVIDKWTNAVNIANTNIPEVDSAIENISILLNDKIITDINTIITKITDFLANDVQDALSNFTSIVDSEISTLINDIKTNEDIKEIDNIYLFIKSILLWMEIVPWFILLFGFIGMILLSLSRKGRINKWFAFPFTATALVIPGIITLFARYDSIDKTYEKNKDKFK